MNMRALVTKPAETFPPGEFIRDELEARGWTQEEFAEILNRPIQTVNQIINGKKEITPATAMALAEAFGTSPEVWLNLEVAYRLSKTDAQDPDVGRRARLRALVPVHELQKRGWIKQTQDLDELEDAVCSFLEINSLQERPRLLVAARRSGDGQELSPAQIAWVFRAKHLAVEMKAPRFDKTRFSNTAPRLARLSRDTNGAQNALSEILQIGIRSVIVPHLPGTRIDGAMFWLNTYSPVVVISLRYNRIDSFWFTLMHELAHVHRGHATLGVLDSDLIGQSAQTCSERREQAADGLATKWLMPEAKLAKFIRRAEPYYYTKKVEAFAEDVGVHPGIVVGRLQHMGKLPWTHLRRLLGRVTDLPASAG